MFVDLLFTFFFALLLSRYSDVKVNSQTLNLGLLDYGAAYTVVLTEVGNCREFERGANNVRSCLSSVCVCLSTGLGQNQASRHGGREGQQCARRLADPSVRPHDYGRGPVLHHGT